MSKFVPPVEVVGRSARMGIPNTKADQQLRHISHQVYTALHIANRSRWLKTTDDLVYKALLEAYELGRREEAGETEDH